MRDPYRGSDAVAVLSKLRGSAAWLFVLDLDGTLAGKSTTDNETTARYALLDLIDSLGATYAFSTARTPELLMSQDAYAASRDNGFSRPQPKWGEREDKTRYFVPLKSLKFFDGLLDPPIMNCFGVGSYLRCGNGYREDTEYRDMLGDDQWRTHASQFLSYVDLGIENYLAAIEVDGAYECNKVDVAPLPFRMELRFPDESTCTDAAFRVGDMQEQLRKGIFNPSWIDIPIPMIDALRLVDESNPLGSSFQRYLVPKMARKEIGIERIATKLVGASGVRRLRRFVAGDTMTDLRSMLYAVADGGVAVLAGDSRLSPKVAKGTFFEEQIPRVTERMEQLSEGVYRDTKSGGFFIVADQEFSSPSGTLKGAESVLAAAQLYFRTYHE